MIGKIFAQKKLYLNVGVVVVIFLHKNDDDFEEGCNVLAANDKLDRCDETFGCREVRSMST